MDLHWLSHCIIGAGLPENAKIGSQINPQNGEQYYFTIIMVIYFFMVYVYVVVGPSAYDHPSTLPV